MYSFMIFYTCLDSCNYHRQNTEQLQCLREFPHTAPCCQTFPSPNPWKPPPCSVPVSLPFPHCRIRGVTQYERFQDWVLSLSIMPLRLTHTVSLWILLDAASRQHGEALLCSVGACRGDRAPPLSQLYTVVSATDLGFGDKGWKMVTDPLVIFNFLFLIKK